MKQIPLTQGKYAIVDDEDYHYLSRFEWFSASDGKDFYARRKHSHSGNDQYLGMEAMIISPKPYSVIIHKNKDTLDYRKENLTYESYSVKRHHADKMLGKTTSKYKGVSFRKTGHPKGKPWSSIIYKDRKSFYLGCYVKEEEAGIAYNKKAKELYGDCAYQNKI
jgi:hypothetical protein